jgi:hypothetical protein
MDPLKFDALLDVLLEENPSEKKLKKAGMTLEELNTFRDSLLKPEKTKYNRIMAEDEKRVLTKEAFGYLMNLLNLNSIDKELFEKILALSIQLNTITKRKISKKTVDELVNYLVFSGQEEVSVKDILDIFFPYESEPIFDDEAN